MKRVRPVRAPEPDPESGPGRQRRGRVPPIPRTLPLDAGQYEEIFEVAAKLKVGEVSPLVLSADGFVAIRCDGVIPADKTKSFNKEKPMLLAEVVRVKINRETAKLFKELKQQANPKYHLTFPEQK